MVHLVPWQEADAPTVSDKFLSIVVSQHRLLECIMSDHEPCYCGHFWDDLMSFLDITVTFSMALHPQTDGVAEVTNHNIE